MKKLQLLFAAMLIGLTSATASEIVSETKTISLDKQGEDLTITKRYRYTQPILFVERGVEFLIFPDGSFDFNTEYGNWSNDDYYYRRKNNRRRGSINAVLGAPGVSINYTSFRPIRGVRVIHDRWGNVRRVGNVFINYDWNGRVKRIGSVYMRYNRRGLVSQIGGLRLIYGRHGRLIRLSGHVNYHNQGCGFCGATGCSADHFGGGHGNDWFDDDYGDDDFYYYRKDGKQKKFKRKNFKKRYKDDDDDD